jgi:hypothetical protein
MFFCRNPLAPPKIKKRSKVDSTLVYFIDCANIEATCFCVVHFEAAIVMHALAQFIQYVFFAKGSFMFFLLSS